VRVTRLTTATGAQEPASLQDLRDFGRIVSGAEDRVLESLLLAARQEVERHSGHVLVPGTFLVAIDDWSPRIGLVLTPVREVTSVTYHRVDGSEDVADPATYYADLGHVPPRLAFSSVYARPWSLRGSAGIEVEVVAGYETKAQVPEDIRQHVITLALLMYEHRDDPAVLERVRRYAADGVRAYVTELV
jgi:uncharacterized phiE125 gp8 family phage protein